MRVTGSIATAPGDPALREWEQDAPDGRLERLLWRVDPAAIGLAFVIVALVVYVLSNPARQNFYNHFVWQADAFLHGQYTIPYPVSGPIPYFQDVLPAAPD